MDKRKEIGCMCNCHQQPVLILDRKETALAISLTIVVLMGVFVGGYFIGKKIAFDSFVKDMNVQSFADRLHHSMTMLYGTDQQLELVEQQVESTPQENPVVVQLAKEEEPKSPLNTNTLERYYAQLARFNTHKSAQQLMHRLQKKGIETTLVKRVSAGRSPEGTPMQVAWYTVNTHSFAQKSELEALVSSIKLTESLKKVRIIANNAQPMKGTSS
jgi:uncharacterized protein YneF (UPF0154 family)